METSETEPEPEKKSDKMEPDEESNNKSENKKDGVEQESEQESVPSDERTAEPEANGTVDDEGKESSQKAKGTLFNFKNSYRLK